SEDDTVVVTLGTGVTVTTLADSTIGTCDTITLATTSTGDGLTYNWSPATGLSGTNVEDPVLYGTSLTAGSSNPYIITVTDQYGCSEDDTVVVTLGAAPVVATIQDTIIGECNVSLELTTNVLGDGPFTFGWTPDDGSLNDVTLQSPQLINPVPGTITYSVTMMDGYGCFAQDQVVIDIQPIPNTGEIYSKTNN
ncbi:MAG: hypothetical protein ACOCVN_00655, partial [bacterium]